MILQNINNNNVPKTKLNYICINGSQIEFGSSFERHIILESLQDYSY